MKKLYIGLLSLLIGAIFILPGCEGVASLTKAIITDNQQTTGQAATTIYLDGEGINIEGNGVLLDRQIATIVSAGEYRLTGVLDEGQIKVNVEDAEDVSLILDGVDITCLTGSPLYIVNANNTTITLADGTQNILTDGQSYVFDEDIIDEPNATLFSRDDLLINGSGSLTVNANYYNGIQSKDDLDIEGGTINVTAVNDAIKGRDSVTISNAIITLATGGDGIQSNNDEDETKGYVLIQSGQIDINAGLDGIQAETNLSIAGGDITITSGGGNTQNPNKANNPGVWEVPNTMANTSSQKGIKAGETLVISGGNIKVDSADDSIHSNGSISINNGQLELLSGDDGIHADSVIEISGGYIAINDCYEGIESSAITINNGNIYITASDDGINTVSDGSSGQIFGMPGQHNPEGSGDNNLAINGGYIVVDAGGDGLDINGSITMTGGTVTVKGPTSNMDGALDYNNGFKLGGGTLIAVGSAGMAQAPDSTSTQYTVMLNLNSTIPANTLIHIENQQGEDTLTFETIKNIQSIVFSSPELEPGETYILYTGGTSSGTENNGVYSGGSYSGGSQISDFTISGMVTVVGSQAGFPGGGLPGGGGGFPGGPRR